MVQTPRSPLQIKYNPVVTPGAYTPSNYVGATTQTGVRGLPAFNDGNTYYIAKTGADTNAGTSAAPKLTFGSLFGTSAGAANITPDLSGNNYALTMTGTVPNYAWPLLAPSSASFANYINSIVPPTTTSYAGPFSSSNYLKSTAAGLLTAINGKTQLTVDGWFYYQSTPGVGLNCRIVQGSTGAALTFDVYADNNRNLNFALNNGGTVIVTTGAPLTLGQWFYFMATYTSGVTGGMQLWLGSSPEAATLVASGTITYTIGANTSVYVGVNGGTAGGFLGYLSRIAIANTARATAPILYGSTGVQAIWTFASTPLAVATPKANIVVKDSFTYNEPIYCPWRYDLVSALGIYALDGQTPTISYAKGATAGTYGAGNAARVKPSNSPNYFVAKTGSNSNPGTSLLPFLTIQKALSTVTANQVIEIQDSGIYQEDVSVPTTCVLQAATGQVPILRNSSKGSTSVHFAASAAATLQIDGCLIDGQGGAGSCCGNFANAVFTFTNCSLLNYTSLANNFAGTFTLTNCSASNVLNVSPVGGTVNQAFNSTNTYYSVPKTSSGAQSTVLITGGTTGTPSTPVLKFSTFANCLLTYSANYGPVSVPAHVLQGCFFNFSSYSASNQSAPQAPMNIVDNLFFEGGVSDAGSNGLFVFANNNLQMGYKGANGFDFTAIGTNNITGTFQNTIAIGNAYNFVGPSGVNGKLLMTQLTSLAASTAGYKVAGSNMLLQYSLDAASTTAFTGGVTPTNFESNAAVASTTQGAENAALLASDAGILNGSAPQLDLGYDWALWEFNVGAALTVNGITFSTAMYQGLYGLIDTNQESGLNNYSLVAGTTAYCTFTNLGTYGVCAASGSTVTHCYFNTNGNAIKVKGYGLTVSYNAGWECAGAFIVHNSQQSTFDHNTAYACAWGQYDSVYASTAANGNSVYVGSQIYDYSGSFTMAYSDVSTLDPTRANAIDSHSTQTNPLFQNALGGVLQLQTIAGGYTFDSPAKSAAQDGQNMGAYLATYSNSSTAWTTVDFNRVDVQTGTPWINPNNVLREMVGVNLSEFDREDLSLESVAVGFVQQFTLTWDAVSAMPPTQAAALAQIWGTLSKRIQVSWDGGSNFIEYSLVRTGSLQWEEVTGLGFTQTGVFTPVKQFVFRSNSQGVSTQWPQP